MSKAISITVYNDADVLKIWLEQVQNEPTIEEYLIVLHCDVGYNAEDVKEVVDASPLEITVHERDYQPKCPLRGFYNILQSYVDTAEMVDEYIIIGEPDIIPTTDYVRFCDYVVRNYLWRYPWIFTVAHKRRVEAELPGDPSLLMGDQQCTSPMVVTVDWVKEYLAPALKHPLFWIDPVGYNATVHPDSRIPPNVMIHHDGTIERIMEKNGMYALKPDQARSLHVGLEGVYCGGDAPQGTLQERYEEYHRLIAQGGDAIRARSKLPGDIVVVPLEGPEWDQLEIDLDRNRCTASTWCYDPLNRFAQNYRDAIENELERADWAELSRRSINRWLKENPY